VFFESEVFELLVQQALIDDEHGRGVRSSKRKPDTQQHARLCFSIPRIWDEFK